MGKAIGLSEQEIKCPLCGSVDQYYKTLSGYDNCTNCIKLIKTFYLDFKKLKHFKKSK